MSEPVKQRVSDEAVRWILDRECNVSQFWMDTVADLRDLRAAYARLEAEKESITSDAVKVLEEVHYLRAEVERLREQVEGMTSLISTLVYGADDDWVETPEGAQAMKDVDTLLTKPPRSEP